MCLIFLSYLLSSRVPLLSVSLSWLAILEVWKGNETCVTHWFQNIKSDARYLMHVRRNLGLEERCASFMWPSSTRIHASWTIKFILVQHRKKEKAIKNRSEKEKELSKQAQEESGVLKQPNIPEDACHRQDEEQPRLPANTSSFRHPHHIVHCAAQTYASIVEGVAHRCNEGGRGAYFFANGFCDLGDSLISTLSPIPLLFYPYSDAELVARANK